MPDLEMTRELGLDSDRFIVLRRLGDDNSVVFNCLDKSLDRRVAIKMLSGQSWDENRIIQFQREARLLSMLSHQNIVRILDFRISDKDRPYIVMEHINGVSLRDHIKNEGPLSTATTLELARQIAEGMHHAHDKGIIHRDLKPSNILLRNAESLEVVILDFGIAIGAEQSNTHSYIGHQFMGTPGYISPEQISGQSVDARADIYSLGCILFECLTGRPPFSGDTALDTIRQHVEQDAPLIRDVSSDNKISDDVEALVASCLSKDPQDRLQTMNALLNRMSTCLYTDSEAVDEVDDDDATANESNESFTAQVETERSNSMSGYLKFAALAFAALATLALIVTGIEKIGISTKTSTSKVARHSLAQKRIFEQTEAQRTQAGVSTHETLTKERFTGNLLRLNYDGADKTNEDMRKLRTDKLNVSRLNLEHSKVTGEGLRHLEGLPASFINLSGRPVTDHDMLYLSKLTRLEQILLNNCKGIKGDGLVHLTNLKKLNLLALDDTSLNLKGLASVGKIHTLSLLSMNNTKVDFLKAFPLLHNLRLHELKLSNTNIGQAELETLARTVSANSLYLSLCRNVTPQALVKLKNMRRLKALTLTEPADTKSFYKAVSELKGLRGITLTQAELNDVEPLSKLNYLHTLTLTQSKPVNHGLSDLRLLSKLKVLQLDTCTVPEDFAKEISKLSLQELTLFRVKPISIGNLRPLSKMQSLRVLNLWEIDGSDKELSSLEAAMPNCDIVRIGGASHLTPVFEP